MLYVMNVFICGPNSFSKKQKIIHTRQDYLYVYSAIQAVVIFYKAIRGFDRMPFDIDTSRAAIVSR